jgi:hypothetical protein
MKMLLTDIGEVKLDLVVRCHPGDRKFRVPCISCYCEDLNKIWIITLVKNEKFGGVQKCGRYGCGLNFIDFNALGIKTISDITVEQIEKYGEIWTKVNSGYYYLPMNENEYGQINDDQELSQVTNFFEKDLLSVITLIMRQKKLQKIKRVK